MKSDQENRPRDLQDKKNSKMSYNYRHKDFINSGSELWIPQKNTWNDVMSTIRKFVTQNPDIIVNVR